MGQNYRLINTDTLENPLTPVVPEKQLKIYAVLLGAIMAQKKRYVLYLKACAVSTA